MTIEHATVQVKRKPWGSTTLVPWNDTPANDDPIGELWFQRALVVSPPFVLEQIDLPAASIWLLDAQKETWIVAIEGHGQIASTKVSVGQAVFAEADHVEIEVGPGGLRALLAYPNVNSGSPKEWRQARPPRTRLKMEEVQTWSH